MLLDLIHLRLRITRTVDVLNNVQKMYNDHISFVVSTTFIAKC